MHVPATRTKDEGSWGRVCAVCSSIAIQAHIRAAATAAAAGAAVVQEWAGRGPAAAHIRSANGESAAKVQRSAAALGLTRQPSCRTRVVVVGGGGGGAAGAAGALCAGTVPSPITSRTC